MTKKMINHFTISLQVLNVHARASTTFISVLPYRSHCAHPRKDLSIK